MASGKQSPRQKMINLMYLVFIAMLALNMSKEVLQAFGLLNNSITETNLAVKERNVGAMESLAQLATDQPEKYKDLNDQAKQIDQISAEYYDYLEGLKKDMMADVEDPTDYQVMDKGDYLDEKFFQGDKLREDGQKFLDKMNQYKSAIATIVGADSELGQDVARKFDNGPVKDREGIEKSYLDYNFKGFPLIASVSKITLLQSNIRNTESEILSTLLGGKLKDEVSLKKYNAIVIPEKTAFFNGERFKGKVVLGKYDNTLVPTEVVINGQKQTNIENGQVNLEFPAGAVGERKLKGKFVFMQDGEPVEIPIESEYAVIPKPNSATIKADKMNVVYRGVDNPMTVSFAGIPNNKVTASATGLSRSGSGYVMRPGSGSKVTINVTGTLSNGEKVTDSEEFRIKDLPRPIGTISREFIDVKKNRSNLAVSTVGATFGDDFDFELTPRVTEFIFKVPGQPSVKISGTKLNGAAKSVLNKARKGDIVQFAKIKATVPGVKLKGVTDVAVELLN